MSVGELGGDGRAVRNLIAALDEIGAEQGWDGEGLLLTAEAGTVGVLPLEGRHPREVLLGMMAPPEWIALGLLMWGWAGPMGGGRPSTSPDRVRSRTVMAVGRDGPLLARTRLSDGRVIDDLPEGGLVDCLRRALGLSTPPPSVGTDLLFAILWLRDIEAVARRERRTLTWAEVARRHPALQMLAEADPDLGGDATILVPAARALASVSGWERIRAECVDRAWSSDLDPKMASWMDTGMVSRWLLDGLGTLPEAVQRVAGLVPPGLARRIRRTLAELGVDAQSERDAPGAA